MRIMRLFREFFVLLVLAIAAPHLFAADAPLLFEQVTLTSSSPSLARAWSRHDAAYKKAHPFDSVWKLNCERTGIPCTEAAWRTQVKPGTVVYLPAPQLVVLAPPASAVPEAIALVPSSTPGVLSVAPAAPVVIAAHVQSEAALRDTAKVLVRANKQSENLVTMLGMLLLIATVGLFSVARRRKVAADRVLWMKNRISDLEEDLTTMTRDRDRLRASSVATTRPETALCEVVDISGERELRARENPAPSVLAHRSIELTCERIGAVGSARDKAGVSYVLNEHTKGYTAELKPGDRFFADVTLEHRVTHVLFALQEPEEQNDDN